MQTERNYIERLIIEQHSHLMKNGMNAIMDLNGKISRHNESSPSRRPYGNEYDENYL